MTAIIEAGCPKRELTEMLAREQVLSSLCPPRCGERSGVTGSVVYISSSIARCSNEFSETKHEHIFSKLCFSPHHDLDRHTPALSLDRDCHGFHRGRISSGHSEARPHSRSVGGT